MEELNKKRICKIITKIMNDCNDTKVQEKLQLIYNRLNDKNSLQKQGFIQRLKSRIYMLSPKYRREWEMEKIKISMKELEEVVSENILTDKIFRHKVLKDYESELGGTINRFLDLHFGVVFDENGNSLKRYDINITDNIKTAAYSEILKQMQKKYINGDISLNDLIKETEEKYMQKIEEITNKAKVVEIAPYYGSREFMEYRISYIKECISGMLNHCKFKGRKDIAEYLQKLQEIHNNYQSILVDSDSIEEQRSNYIQLENLYKQALSIENKLSIDVEQVWKERINQKNATEGQMAYLAHVITGGEFDPKHMNKVCATYITEQTLTLPYGDYGFIYPMDMENILQMSFTDGGSWKISKERFIESGLCTAWQFAEPIDESGNRMFFEYPPHVSKLLLPDDVERKTIQETIKLNGEMLNYDKFMPYNEVVIINKNKQMMPIAVFVRTNGNEEDTDKVKKAKALSEKLGIELKRFDKSKLRENLGLQSFTPGELAKFEKER